MSEAGCTGQRWIAVRDPAAPCVQDPLGIWTGQKLFKGPVGGPPQALARYCVYEWTGNRVNGPGANQCLPYGAAGPGQDEIDQLSAILGGSADLGEDCIDTAPLTFEEDVASWARDELWKRAGGEDPLPVSPGPPASPVPTRLYAVDTSPDALQGGIALGQSRHGDTVAHIARDLACPNGESAPCAAHVATGLGLPRDDLANPLTTNLVQGGLFGTEGDLAQAIENAVLAWRADVTTGAAEPRLVLNLSVGWEDQPSRNNCVTKDLATNPESLSPPARAVLDAMRYATCHGALILAAAGNDTGGPTPADGLVCPARWEEIAAPDSKTCDDLLGAVFVATYDERFPDFPRRPDPSQVLYDRVVYAVGGVDQGDLPLVPARRGARPRLAALGLLGSAWDDSPNGAVTPNGQGQPASPPPLMTGTSVATAVASAVAAAVWAYKPSVTAPEILDAVYAASVPLTQGGANIVADPDTCVGTNQCEVRRVSLCRALGLPCTDAAPVGVSGDPLQNATLPPALVATLVSEFATATTSQATFPDNLPIPHAQYPTVASSPWTFPQPNWPNCPACTLSIESPNSVILYAKPGIPMRDISLVVVDRAGVARSGHVAPLAAGGALLEIGVNVSAFDATQIRSAWLSGATTTATGATVSVFEQIALTGN